MNFAFAFLISIVSASFYSQFEQVDIDFATLALTAPAFPTNAFNFISYGNLSNPYEVIVTDVTPDNRTLLQFDGAVGVSAANAANRTGTILQIQVIDRFEQILYSDIQRFYVAEIVVAPGFGSDVQVHFNRQSTSNITSTRSIYPTPIRGPPSWNVTLNAPSRQPVVISSMTVIKGVWFSDQRDNNYRGKPIGFGFIVACVFGGIVFVAVVVGVVIFIVRRRRALAVTIL